MAVEKPFRIGDYTELGVLNEEHGVFLVQHRLSRRVHVLKLLSKDAIPVIEGLIDEPADGMPHIYDAIPIKTGIAVVEQYIDGVTLDFILKLRGAIDEDAALDYCKRIAVILHGLHSRKPPVIHRDIKPSNVMITGEGRLYLIDIDAAKLYSGGSARDTHLLGTEGYAAPEQYGFGSSTPETDVYSLGVLLNKLVTGALPNERMAGGKVGRIVEKCTDIDPKNRYKSAAELLGALNRAGGRRVTVKGHRPASQFRPLGFRSLTPWKMLLGLMYYGFSAIMAFSIGLPSDDSVATWAVRITFFLDLFLGAAIPGNFCGILDIMGISRIKSQKARVTVTVLFDITVTVTLLVLAAVISR
ncbi:MAG: serine/threonine protein kinase [Clostridia bacterium]|nr:serine/threonine protein kinase [Clostridia bacterium]